MVIFVSLNLTGILSFPNLAEFHDTAPLTIQSHPVNTNTEGVIEGVHINGVSILSRLNLEEIYRGYYMATWGYKISLQVLKNISRVCAAIE